MKSENIVEEQYPAEPVSWGRTRLNLLKYGLSNRTWSQSVHYQICNSTRNGKGKKAGINERDVNEGTVFRAVFEDMFIVSRRVKFHVPSYRFSIVSSIRGDRTIETCLRLSAGSQQCSRIPLRLVVIVVTSCHHFDRRLRNPACSGNICGPSVSSPYQI